MRDKEFVPGQLVWITSGPSPIKDGLIPCRSGYPKHLALKPEAPGTIIRKALAKDYGIFIRFTHKGVSQAKRLADQDWLILYEGQQVLVFGGLLRKRRYKPRKTKQ